jgi:NAD(P)H dehydrogenase (quinone)
MGASGFDMVAGTQTDADAAPDDVHASDVATCHHPGQRVTTLTRQLNLGRAASAPEASSALVR